MSKETKEAEPVSKITVVANYIPSVQEGEIESLWGVEFKCNKDGDQLFLQADLPKDEADSMIETQRVIIK